MGLKEKQLASLFDQAIEVLNSEFGEHLQKTYAWPVVFSYDPNSIPDANKVSDVAYWYASNKDNNIISSYLKFVANKVIIADIAKHAKPNEDPTTWGELAKIAKIHFVFGTTNQVKLADGVLTVTDDVISEAFELCNGEYKHQKKMSDELLNQL
ncbi:MAG: hypothetical protein A2289_03970 [Deltaproteobacteria bacterium RIFOXYA12_FULL_58_15]|nr:MAG: hypothetical protein A2289_03970 [Deltaproteobacteria bacterium RIFOXYA12_FULL_58_15]OGR11500.1 MAG: hypothetical protein A2341_28400 [Deltaproteobacteria bacterium RIFOXYB12_FULL_58_9]